MLPYEGIKARQHVTGHPESCRIRPHSKTWGASAGPAVSVVKTTKKVVPEQKHHTGLPKKRAVLLPMGPAIPSLPTTDNTIPISPPAFGLPTSPGNDPLPVSPMTSGAGVDDLAAGRPAPCFPPPRVMSPDKCASVAFSPKKDVLRITDKEETLPDARRNTVTLLDLTPAVPPPEVTRYNLKRIDLASAIPENNPVTLCLTPRFHCPRNVDCTQGSGPQEIPNFAQNPDGDVSGIDQALHFEVQTQKNEFFSELPRIDCFGTLFFTPSTRSGVVKCAAMVTDHACAIDLGTKENSNEPDFGFKQSDWLGFTITIQVKKAEKKTNFGRDWRTYNNKMTAPVGSVPVPPETHRTSPTLSPSASPKGFSQTQSQSFNTKKDSGPLHAFPPCNIALLRISADQKWNRDKAMLLTKHIVPWKVVTYLNEMRSLSDKRTPTEATSAMQVVQARVFDVLSLKDQDEFTTLTIDHEQRLKAIHSKETSYKSRKKIDFHGVNLLEDCQLLGKLHFASRKLENAKNTLLFCVALNEYYIGVENCFESYESATAWESDVEKFVLGLANADAVDRVETFGGENSLTERLTAWSSILTLLAVVLKHVGELEDSVTFLNQSYFLLGLVQRVSGEKTDTSELQVSINLQVAEIHLIRNNAADAKPVLVKLLQACGLPTVFPDEAEGVPAIEDMANSASDSQKLLTNNVPKDSNSQKVSDLYLLSAMYFCQIGYFGRAQANLMQCLKLRQQDKSNSGQDAVSLAEVHLCMARVHDICGQIEQCLKEATEAAEILSARRSELGNNTSKLDELQAVSTLYVFALVTLGFAHTTKGKYSATLPLLEKARNVSAVTAAGVSRVMQPFGACASLALGSFYCAQKKYSSAQPLLESAFQAFAHSFGRAHYLTAVSEAVYAYVLFNISYDPTLLVKHPKAEKSQKLEEHGKHLDYIVHAQYSLMQAINERSELHSLVYEVLGEVYAKRDVAKCLAPLLRSYDIVRTLNGAEKELRPSKIMSQLCWAFCSLRETPSDELIDIFQEELEQKQRKCGEWDLATCPLLQCMAELYYAKENYTEAARLFTRMLKISDTQNLLFLLGNLFKPASQLQEQQIKERNRLASDKASGDTAPAFAVVLLQLGAVQEASEMWADAEATYLQARAAFEIANRPDHPGVCAALNGIGRILYNSGMYGDSLSYFHKTFEVASELKAVHSENLVQATEYIRVVNKRLVSLDYLLERYEVCTFSPTVCLKLSQTNRFLAAACSSRCIFKHGGRDVKKGKKVSKPPFLARFGELHRFPLLFLCSHKNYHVVFPEVIGFALCPPYSLPHFFSPSPSTPFPKGPSIFFSLSFFVCPQLLL